MYLYKIGYWDKKSEFSVLIANKKLITKDRFEALIYSAIEGAIELKIYNKKYVHCFKDIYTEVLDFFTLKHNFIPLDLAYSWNCYGDASMFVNDYDANADKVLEQIRKDLQQNGYGFDNDCEYNKYFSKK